MGAFMSINKRTHTYIGAFSALLFTAIQGFNSQLFYPSRAQWHTGALSTYREANSWSCCNPFQP
jgi:hypothetical protein